MRSSGTFTVPRWTVPPKPVGTFRPVRVLKTVVFPEPAKPTRPIFILTLVRETVARARGGGSCGRLPSSRPPWPETGMSESPPDIRVGRGSASWRVGARWSRGAAPAGLRAHLPVPAGS